MLLPSGPQIAIIDDRPDQVEPIIRALKDQEIGCLYFNAAIDQDRHPRHPIDSIETIFLDLFYQEGLRDFDAELCAGWINSIVPAKHNFNLVIWTKDSNYVDPLLETLELIHRKPIFHYPAQKNHYMVNGAFNINRLFSDLETSYRSFYPTRIKDIHGEIVDIQNDHVLVNCLLDRENPVYQVRRFERELVEHSPIDFRIGSFLVIRTTTSPGKKVFEFINEPEDLRKEFEQVDYFSQFKDTPFIKGNKNEDNV